MAARSRRSACWLLAVTLSSPLLPRVANADSAPASDEASAEQRRNEAKAKYQQGAEAYSAGHYKDAVDLFLAADHLAPSAPLSFNIARAYEKLGDDSGALRWYRDYVRRNPTAANADSVHALITQLASSLQKKGVQQLTVLSSPPGATVTIDDQPLGVTPWTGELSPGPHHALITQRGYVDAAHDFSLSPSEPLDLSVRLQQQLEPSAPVASAQPTPVQNQKSVASQPAASRGPKLGLVPWVTLGAGVAALGGALTFELLRRSSEQDAKAQLTQLGYQDRLQSEQSRQTSARVFLGIGGALVVAGGVMLLIDGGATHHPASAGLYCVPETCGVTARGRF